MSRLKKYCPDPQHVLANEEVHLQEDLSYKEESIEILDKNVIVLQMKEVPLVKILWKYQDVRDATWETEERMQEQYLYLFTNTGMNFEDEILLKRENIRS